MKLIANISPPKSIVVAINPSAMGIGFGTPIARDYVGCDPYMGDYTITPSTETQVFQTKNMRMTDDLTINPIPNYYGLITYDGSGLTVS